MKLRSEKSRDTFAISNIIEIWLILAFRFIFFDIVVPSIYVIMTSLITRSGIISRIFSYPSFPLLAEYTLYASDRSFSRYDDISSLSSTISTLKSVFVLAFLCGIAGKNIRDHSSKVYQHSIKPFYYLRPLKFQQYETSLFIPLH